MIHLFRFDSAGARGGLRVVALVLVECLCSSLGLFLVWFARNFRKNRCDLRLDTWYLVGGVLLMNWACCELGLGA